MQLLDIPEIFNPSSNSLDSIALTTIDSNSRWTEFVAHLSQFGELNVPDTRDQLELLLSSEANPENRIALITGIAKCEIGEGRLLQAAELLGYAYSELGPGQDNVRAFVLLEMVGLLAVIGSYDNALMVLRTIPGLTDSEYLLKIANYYGLVNVGRKGDHGVIEALLDSAEYFQGIGQKSTLAYHYKNIGNIYGKMKDFASTQKYYDMALDLTGEDQFAHIRTAVLHDVGMLQHRQGHFNQAVETLSRCAEQATSHYTRSYTLGNIGYLYYHLDDHSHASRYFEQSLQIANENGVFHLVASTCYYLGMSYQTTGNLQKAHAYFEHGSELALELANRKLPLKGERLLIVNQYIRFLKEYDPQEYTGPKQYEFPFALGKTMREIRAAFQETLLDSILQETGSVRNTVKKLAMAERTYSKARERNQKLSLNIDAKDLESFIHDHRSLEWKEINRKFDDNVITFLLHQKGMSKKALSQQLEVNYSRLVTRCNQIEIPDAMSPTLFKQLPQGANSHD